MIVQTYLLSLKFHVFKARSKNVRPLVLGHFASALPEKILSAAVGLKLNGAGYLSRSHLNRLHAPKPHTKFCFQHLLTREDVKEEAVSLTSMRGKIFPYLRQLCIKSWQPLEYKNTFCKKTRPWLITNFFRHSAQHVKKMVVLVSYL